MSVLESVKGYHAWREVLDLSRVVELGMRCGVHHQVARLNLSKFFRLRVSRDWENSYPKVLAVKDRAKSSVSFEVQKCPQKIHLYSLFCF